MKDQKIFFFLKIDFFGGVCVCVCKNPNQIKA